MKELSKDPSGSLLQTLHADLKTPAPYSADLFLIRTEIAGTSHVVGIEELEPFLRPGDRLELVRIPDNPSDQNAIKIFTRDRIKLGYVPRKDNLILARLMDAGKLLYALLAEKRWQREWLCLTVEIFMTED